MDYTGTLHTKAQTVKTWYTRAELERLTTLQLREICFRENIAIARSFSLNRNHMIGLILKYLGARVFSKIDTFDADSFDHVTQNFNRFIKNNMIPAAHIQIPTRMTFYKGLDTVLADHYVIKGHLLSEGHAFLLSEDNQILGILTIERSQDEYFITCGKNFLLPSMEPRLYKNCKIGFLDEKGSRFLCKYYYEGGYPHAVRVECFIKPIQEFYMAEPSSFETALVIDFGTSNTAAGAWLYSDKIHPVLAEDLNKNGMTLDALNKVRFLNEEILPTVVRIKDCLDCNHIQFQFGYEALNENRRKGYADKATLFYGIKKWVNQYNKREDVFDEQGNYASIARSDILREYLLYVIEAAQQQHKCYYKNLHITSPIKQKQQFLKMYKDILPGYAIEQDNALDEGVAVLYNVISGQIARKNFRNGERYRALVIDCGGGTTDFTTCEYHIDYREHTHELAMTTTYANGESNFGGNNLTFRIFQYLKVIFSQYYTHIDITLVGDLMGMHKTDIYRKVDHDGIKTIYAKLEDAYGKAEALIPTQFYTYMHASQEDYVRVRHNFYFLWHLAEKIKVEFYQSVGILHTRFHEYGLARDSKDMKIIAEESWRLYVTVDGTLTAKTDYPKVMLSKEEANLLISADIYYIVKKFIEPLFTTDKIYGFNAIRLTGQSCKIELFRDALKEFIPGRLIAFPDSENNILDLKLTCLEGAVKYQNARRIGNIRPHLHQGVAFAPFRLTYTSHAGEEKILISGLDRVNVIYGFVQSSIEASRFTLTLSNCDGMEIRRYVLHIAASDFKATTYEEIFAAKSKQETKILQKDIDDMVDGEMRIFTYSFEDVWGFYTLPVARKEGFLCMGEQQYIPFEDDNGNQSFFEGKI